MSAIAVEAVPCRHVSVDLDCHVLPLLDAIVWMGQASWKLAEIKTLESLVPEGCAGYAGDAAWPEPVNCSELMSGVAWVAGSLLRTYQHEQDEAAEEGSL